MNLRIPIAIQANGKPARPHEVSQGKDCNCTCPGCGKPVLSRQGEIRQWHFAHIGEDCQHAAESALHLWAKQVIETQKTLTTPPLNVHDSNGLVFRVETPKSLITLETVILESRKPQFVPDVEAIYQGTPLFIEIAVTHPCDDEKIQKLQDYGVAALEISIPLSHTDDTDSEFAAFVLHRAQRRWLFHPRQAQLNAELAAQLAELEAIKQAQEEHARRLQQERERQRQEQAQAERAARLQAMDEASRRRHEQAEAEQRQREAERQRQEAEEARIQAAIRRPLNGLTINQHIAQYRSHHTATAPSQCAHCGQPGQLIPHGIGPWTWLHHTCWEPWRKAR